LKIRFDELMGRARDSQESLWSTKGQRLENTNYQVDLWPKSFTVLTHSPLQ